LQTQTHAGKYIAFWVVKFDPETDLIVDWINFGADENNLAFALDD
jgi:hypothetical protein